jgi:hypothetical protein
MKKGVSRIIALTTGLLVTAHLGGCLTTGQRIVSYPAPGDEAVTGDYAVTVNGRPVDVYAAQGQYFGGDYAFASFDFGGRAEIRVTSLSPLDNVQIQPARYAGWLKRIGTHEIALSANAPFRLSVERNGRIKPLLLFGNALETDAPKPGAPGVVYFAPGVHRPGKIELTDNQTLYLAGGAVVKGCVHAQGTNITIRGRGILGGEDSPRFKGPGRYLLDCQNCRNLTVRDVTLRNPWGWTFVTWACDGVVIDNVKICGSRMINDDALDLVNTRNATVRNCFFRTQDDSIAIKGLAKMPAPCENILIESCTFWTDRANIFRIGYECETSGMRDICARDIDVVHYSMNYRAPTEYWANAIIWLQPNQDLLMERCRFENLRVRSDGDDILMLMAKPMRCRYGEYKEPEPGALRDCSFKDIAVTGSQRSFQGLLYITGDGPKHAVSGLHFENIVYFGKPVMRDASCVRVGPYADDITFR